MYNPDKLTDVYVKYGITPNQFYVLYLIHIRDWDNLYRYKEGVVSKEVVGQDKRPIKLHGFDADEELQPLIDKGYLEDPFVRGTSRSKFEIIDLMVTPKFSDVLFVEFQAGEELFKVYPQFIEINGQRVTAKMGEKIGDKYYGKDELIELYLKKIGYSKDKHKWVIDKTKLAVEQKLINFPLRKYIFDELWDTFGDLESTQSSSKHGFI